MSSNPREAPPAATLDDWLIDRYLDFLFSQRRYAAHTVQAYRNDLDKLTTLFKQRALTQLQHHDIRLAVSQIHSQGDTPKTITRRLSSWRSFYRWLAQRGLSEALAAGWDSPTLDANPVEGIRAPKMPQRLPKALSQHHAQVLLDTPSPPTPAPDQPPTTDTAHAKALALRDQAILELFYSAGLRLAELISLDQHAYQQHGYQSLSWLDIDHAEVRVTGKGSKTRIVPVGSRAIAALSAWLAVRHLIAFDEHALFVGARGQRISTSAIQLLVKARARAAQTPGNVHPHVLRHSFASHMLQASRDLRAVQEMMGHASLTSTQVYTSLDFSHLSQVYDAAHPRAKKKP